jgi:hypothetical protein
VRGAAAARAHRAGLIGTDAEPHPTLSTGERVRLVGEILGVYVKARWLISRGDLPTVMAKLRAGAEPTSLPLGRQELIGRRLAWIVSRVLSLLPTDSRCLIRSVTLSTLLARRGIPSSVVIGVRSEPEFAAHAWVEHDGSPLLPTEDVFHRLHEV